MGRLLHRTSRSIRPLAGLLFVGISINIAAIAASMRLGTPALEAFVLLVEILLVGTDVDPRRIPRLLWGGGSWGSVWPHGR